MKLIYLWTRFVQKLRNKIGLSLYLKQNKIEVLDVDLNESLLDEKWKFEKTDCFKVCLPELEAIELIDLSIIVPLYNSEKFIQTCMKGFLNQQTKYHFEVILVNDGSKDQTLNLLKKFHTH